ncbi:unnamed protein product [Blepharisma stoltei]|uniref:Translin-associated factor X-interacting protein 1 N-terminal domain-containing protein n=1 Tax=Blepharisma stoltei TaxID=1481888 RepID=A0AAU9ITP4_9CILI|nr:unnamed protein product [Blepharisma stoltei]
MRRKHSVSEIKRMRRENITFRDYIEKMQTENTMMTTPRALITSPVIDSPLVTKELSRSTNNFPSFTSRIKTASKKDRFNHPSHILATARIIELQSPKDPLLKASVQHESILRLFRGSRGDPAYNPALTKFQPHEDSVKLEKEAEENEEQDFEKYIDGLKFMDKLKSELSLNFQIARSKEFNKVPKNPALGSFFQVEKELKELQETKLSQLLQMTRGEMVNKISQYSTIVRDIIRAIRNKDGDDEAVILETFWRIIVKTFDTFIRMHDQTVEQSINISISKLRASIEQNRVEIRDIIDKYKNDKSSYEKNIKELTSLCDQLAKEKVNLKQIILDKEIQIAEVTEIDNRFEVLRSMGNLLNDLNLVILETKDEQEKQAFTLNKLTSIMSVAPLFEDKKEAHMPKQQEIEIRS